MKKLVRTIPQKLHQPSRLRAFLRETLFKAGTSAAALALLIALIAGCAGLPAPKNANGSLNPSVAVAEGELAYSNATEDAAQYATACHANMATIGCSEATITQLKAASDTALRSLFAAENAVRQLPAGATTGATSEIAAMQKDTNALKALTPKH
jgi:uncharacterized protein HemX